MKAVKFEKFRIGMLSPKRTEFSNYIMSRVQNISKFNQKYLVDGTRSSPPLEGKHFQTDTGSPTNRIASIDERMAELLNIGPN